MQNLNQLKKHILSLVDENWSDLEKARFVYLEAGKYLEKHTEFYLTLDDKLTKSRLQPKKLDKIYLGRLNKEEWNKMICKTGAEFIKDILEELKIKSSLIETIDYIKVKGMKNHIHHFSLCINIGKENIFATPASDYSYIKEGMSTKHFGIEMPFIKDGEYLYKGPIIPHRVLTKLELKKIDEKIGYLTKISNDKKSYYTYIDDELSNDKTSYDDFLAVQTPFYNSILPEDDENKDIISLSDPDNDWDALLTKICIYVGQRLSIITGFPYEYRKYINKENFEEWSNYCEGMFYDKNYDIKTTYYANPSLLFNKTKKICKLVMNFKEQEEKEYNLKDDYIAFRTSFNKTLLDISKHFIDSKLVLEPSQRDEYVSNSFINYKFCRFFPELVNANTGLREELNNNGYSDQIEIVKRTIEYMYQDLKEKNLLQKKDDSFSLSPIFKRINLFSVKNKHKDEYAIFIAITDSEEDNATASYWYKYNLVENTFERTSPIKMAKECAKNGKYEVVSNRLKSLFEDLENNGRGNSNTYKLGLKKRD